LLSGTLAIAATLCLWWLYFRAEPIALKHVSSTEDRVYASRMAGNGLLVLIAGLIALAAGNALVIDHPTRDSALALALLLFGGPALFLLTQAWYLRLVFGTTPRSHLFAIAALAAVTAASLPAPALVAGIGVVAVLAALVAVEHYKTTDQSSSEGSPTSP
jgi:low temperature requirement protein LtrA